MSLMGEDKHEAQHSIQQSSVKKKKKMQCNKHLWNTA